jgi:hypothetical protein
MATTTKALARTAAATVSIAANSVFSFDLKQVFAATKVIAGFASATTIQFHISGVEVA